MLHADVALYVGSITSRCSGEWAHAHPEESGGNRAYVICNGNNSRAYEDRHHACRQAQAYKRKHNSSAQVTTAGTSKSTEYSPANIWPLLKLGFCAFDWRKTSSYLFYSLTGSSNNIIFAWKWNEQFSRQNSVNQGKQNKHNNSNNFRNIIFWANLCSV